MRNNQPVTDREYQYPDDWILLSTTNTDSTITYANDSFCEVAGYQLDELSTQPHNIVRHPHMPPQAFENLWKHLKKGEPWKGLVKNRCANGDHYWVDAFVTPISENGQIVEYQSVRTKPRQEHVKRAEDAYQQLNEKGTVSKLKARLSLPVRLALLAFVAFLPMFYLAWQSGVVGFALLTTSFGGLLIGGHLLLNRFSQLVGKSKKIYDNPLMSMLYTGHTDDVAQIDLALQMQNSEIKAVLGRALDSCEQVAKNAVDSSTKCEEVQANSQSQLLEMEQVATAMEEMTATLTDMADNCVGAANSSQQASDEAIAGDNIVSTTIGSIESMSEQLVETSRIITELEEHSNGIGAVLDVIQGIAEQTNLLALNAAIEAARAGEQGRGFAVVADEVRALAKRSHESTTEIQNIINLLQQGTSKAVESMRNGVDSAQSCVDQAALAGDALKTIRTAVGSISEMTQHIASAVEQQSSVSNEVNNNIAAAVQLTDNSHKLGEEMVGLNGAVVEKINSQQMLVGQFLKRSFEHS